MARSSTGWSGVGAHGLRPAPGLVILGCSVHRAVSAHHGSTESVCQKDGFLMSKDNSELVSTLLSSLSSEEKVSLLAQLVGGAKKPAKSRGEKTELPMVEGNFSSVSGLLEACRFQHAYTTYKDVAKILNLGAYRPSHTATVVAAADACGKNYSAFVVSQRGCQDTRVHSCHHTTLVAFGFEVFPSCSG